jgi:hypothetical protein
MFTLPVRIILIVIAAFFGTYNLANGYQTGYLWLSAALLFVIGYFRYGSVRPAFMAL